VQHESGDDQVLAAVHRGETFESTREALDKFGAAGITRSVMMLNDLGGTAYSRQHAENSARLAYSTQPEYLATLVVKGTLGAEKDRLLVQVRQAIATPEQAHLRPAWTRGL
jgi:hypothetical protein